MRDVRKSLAVKHVKQTSSEGHIHWKDVNAKRNQEKSTSTEGHQLKERSHQLKGVNVKETSGEGDINVKDIKGHLDEVEGGDWAPCRPHQQSCRCRTR